MPTVLNNGAPITIKLDGERHEIPSGESEQPAEALEHPLCKALASERSPIMEPKGDDPKGEMIQRKGFRLVIDGKLPTDKEAAKSKKEMQKAQKDAEAAAKKEAAAMKKAQKADEAAAKKKAEAEAKAAAKAAG